LRSSDGSSFGNWHTTQLPANPTRRVGVDTTTQAIGVTGVHLTAAHGRGGHEVQFPCEDEIFTIHVWFWRASTMVGRVVKACHGMGGDIRSDCRRFRQFRRAASTVTDITEILGTHFAVSVVMT
jgi:hypothetical protein